MPVLTLSAVRAFLADQREPRWRFTQITDAIFGARIPTFAEMHPLPRDLRARLTDRFGPSVLGLRALTVTDAPQATKVLFGYPDGARVEAVGLRYRAGWESFCISTQAGCSMACAFCTTGTLGLSRNLTADEIAEQVLWFHLAGRRIDSVSFMGMGEPLANPATLDALSVLTDPGVFGLSPRRITVSTVGLPAGIRRLAREHPRVNLTVSLHAPDDALRARLIPGAHPVARLLAAIDEHIAVAGRQVSIAYVLLDGVNDSVGHARSLARLLEGRPLVHVNLIPYNEAAGGFRAAGEHAVRAFRDALRARGVGVSIRRSFGVAARAGCGQLAARPP